MLISAGGVLLIGVDNNNRIQGVNMFTVTLQRPLKTSEKTSEKIVQCIKENPQITIGELAEKIGKTTRTIEMQIKRLKAQKKIERIGPDKGGSWKIINKN